MPRADRLVALVQLLGSPGRRTLRELAERLGTSERSIYRDLADLEARGIAIERDGGRYRLLEGTTARVLPLTPRERVLLTIALENPGFESQPAYRRSVRELRTKLAAYRAGGSSATLAGPERSGAVAEEVIDALEQAIAAPHSVTVLYDSLSSGRRGWRGIDPWGLIHRSDAWYLIGRCHLHDEPRTFRLDRVEAILPIGRSFARPREFDPASWFAQSWGVEVSHDQLHDVRVLFDRSVAPLIEHARHHPSEEKRRLADGGLEYRVRIGPLEELARWITGFGGAAVAIEPAELVQRVRAIASGAAQAHPAPRAVAAHKANAPVRPSRATR